MPDNSFHLIQIGLEIREGQFRMSRMFHNDVWPEFAQTHCTPSAHPTNEEMDIKVVFSRLVP